MKKVDFRSCVAYFNQLFYCLLTGSYTIRIKEKMNEYPDWDDDRTPHTNNKAKVKKLEL